MKDSANSKRITWSLLYTRVTYYFTSSNVVTTSWIWATLIFCQNQEKIPFRSVGIEKIQTKMLSWGRTMLGHLNPRRKSSLQYISLAKNHNAKTRRQIKSHRKSQALCLNTSNLFTTYLILVQLTLWLTSSMVRVIRDWILHVDKVKINQLHERRVKRGEGTIRFANLIKEILSQVKTQWLKTLCWSWRSSK